MKKKISVVIPTYNEEANVVPLAKAVSEVMERDLKEYDYEILFIDNHSKDNTQALLRGLCANNKKIKAIFNAKNFGQARSPVYGMKQAYGDCVVRMCADFQDPVDMIPKFVREWEQGTKIVIGVKSASKERKGMYWIRSCYYKVINKITFFGALYLGIVALLPIIVGDILKISNLSIGGTSVIIVVGVALETVAAMEAQMLMRHYKGFLE